MIRHLPGIAGLTVMIVGCRLLPFAPGGYDLFAVPLAGVAQGAALGGLLLLPIGALWMLVALRRPRAQYVFAIVAVIAASAMALLGALMMSLAASATLGALMFGLWAFGVRKAVPAIRRLKDAGSQRLSPASCYLVIVPALAAALQYVLVGPAAAFSRERAIGNSAALLAGIEAYHKTHGRYPAAVNGLWQDYRPSIVGVERYYYEPSGEAFNIYFEHPSSVLGAREIVMYNKLDQHHFTSHDSDILLWTPEQLLARRTYVSRHDTPIAHWKYFWFD